jgi:predicted nucleic acid-binding protein
MAYCADTNILLRWIQPGTDASRQARAAVDALHINGEAVYITPQNLVEFWTVATRPAEVNGLGLSPAQADVEMANMERLFPLLPDTPAIHDEWRRMVLDNNVSGVRTHDARLAAAARIHGITHILTFNVSDFRSFGNPTPVHPIELIP